jgi:hypothetical protein
MADVVTGGTLYPQPSAARHDDSPTFICAAQAVYGTGKDPGEGSRTEANGGQELPPRPARMGILLLPGLLNAHTSTGRFVVERDRYINRYIDG